MDPSIVQILVVVVNTYVRIIWTDEEKGFIAIMYSYELVDPKTVHEGEYMIGGNACRLHVLSVEREYGQHSITSSG